jgi:CheY-like chemotaxis protein
MPTVLYADDEQEHRLMMQVIMKNEEITLLEAANGEEAIETIKHQQPNLVLLDLFMPRIDGFGVLQAIKSDPKTRDIPIIILSAWPTGDNRERARNFGAVDFVAKPYDPLRLIQLVQQHLPIEKERAPTGDTAPLTQ